MVETLHLRMEMARNNILKCLSDSALKYDLPAFVLEEIVADLLGDMRQASKIELIRELEMHNDESIQSDNVEE